MQGGCTRIEEEVELIIATRKEHPVGAVGLEKILDSMGSHIPITASTRSSCSIGSPNLSQRNRGVGDHGYGTSEGTATRFGMQTGSRKPESRFGTFTNATAVNAKAVLEQLMTDHGPQFTSLPRETCAEPTPSEFQRFLSES